MRHVLFIMAAWGWMAAIPCLAREGKSQWSDWWPDQLELSGWAEAIQSIRLKTPNDSLTSRAKLRLEISADTDGFYGFVSADAEKNRKISSETGVRLHEVWVEHAADNWDLRIGRQIIIWGKADGIQVTDMISPPDYTESITRELDEIRMPVDAAKFRWLEDAVDTELIWIPVFKAAVIPSGDNPWAVQRQYPDDVQVISTPTRKPETSLADSEIALKVSSFFSGFDLAASVFYTWNDYATFHRTIGFDGDAAQVTFNPRHERMTVLGLEGAMPWADFVFRAEAAGYLGRYYAPKSVYDPPLQKDGYKWLGGIDWNPGNDWNLTAQLAGEGIFNHDHRLADPAHQTMATLNISKKLLNQTLTLSNMVYWRIEDAEIFDRIRAEYEITDGLHLLAGADIFHGDDGQYGAYEDNSQIWVKVKYSF